VTETNHERPTALDLGLAEDIKRLAEKIQTEMFNSDSDLTTGEFQTLLGVLSILEGVHVGFKYRIKREKLHAERLQRS